MCRVWCSHVPEAAHIDSSFQIRPGPIDLSNDALNASDDATEAQHLSNISHDSGTSRDPMSGRGGRQGLARAATLPSMAPAAPCAVHGAAASPTTTRPICSIAKVTSSFDLPNVIPYPERPPSAAALVRLRPKKMRVCRVHAQPLAAMHDIIARLCRSGTI